MVVFCVIVISLTEISNCKIELFQNLNQKLEVFIIKSEHQFWGGKKRALNASSPFDETVS